jgi:biotin carboxyl carrier protein
MADPLELRAEERDGQRRLLSPGVGLFTGATPPGRVLTPGEEAGQLIVLGRAVTLVVPPGVAGVVRSAAPERVHQPVGWGTVLYELEDLGAGATLTAEESGVQEPGVTGPVLRAPQTGRFWHRSSPGEPPMVEPGALLSEGAAVGLIEVMKTFTQVPYRATGGLPKRARVVQVLAGDGEDVAEGAPLIEVEPEG